jgi:hypothetical protein
MSKSKNDNDIRYTREKLLASKALSGYQKDFAAVILTNETYTLSEAKAALDAVLKKGV